MNKEKVIETVNPSPPVKLEVVVENGQHILYAGDERISYLIETTIKDKAGQIMEVSAEVMVNSDNEAAAALQLVWFKGVLFTPLLKCIDIIHVLKKIRAPGEDFDRVIIYGFATFATKAKPAHPFTKNKTGVFIPPRVKRPDYDINE